jgi:hypothetical protein
LSLTNRSRMRSSISVKTSSGLASGAMRLVMVSQKTRQLRIQKTASRFVSRAVVLRRDCLARQPDFRIL